MTRLECGVTSCAANAEGCCCRPAIKVQGHTAECCEETRCQSFVPKNSEMSNSTHVSEPNPECDVRCTACNCAYNCDGECKADCVCMSGYDAQSMSATECDSFRRK